MRTEKNGKGFIIGQPTLMKISAENDGYYEYQMRRNARECNGDLLLRYSLYSHLANNDRSPEKPQEMQYIPSLHLNQMLSKCQSDAWLVC
jgi:hypothetical protein